jgi:methylenetetrahydrofolate dehydrogenase (NADP+)/methenyltetrahydrofolate cyclohydrolase
MSAATEQKSSPMSLSDDSRYLKGGPVAQRIIAAVREDAAIAKAEGFPPKLISITVGDTAAVDVYVRNQRAKAQLAGIDFEGRCRRRCIRSRMSRACIRLRSATSSTTSSTSRPAPRPPRSSC